MTKNKPIEIKEGVLLSSFVGFEIIQSSPLDLYIKIYQYKFPKSKKKRIRNKWLKNPQSYKKRHTVLKSENRLYVDKEFCEMLLTGDVGEIKREVVFAELPSLPKMSMPAAIEERVFEGKTRWFSDGMGVHVKGF